MKTSVKALTIATSAGLLAGVLSACAGAAPAAPAGMTPDPAVPEQSAPPASTPSAGPRSVIAQEHFGRGGQAVVTTGANVTLVSSDAGNRWSPLNVPGELPFGHPVDVRGIAIAAASVDANGNLTYQRSGDGGKTWAGQRLGAAHGAPAQVDVTTIDDGSFVAVAAQMPHSSGIEGVSNLFVGAVGGDLVQRTMPNDGSAYWVGKHLLAIGGALNSRLYVSDDLGATWTQSSVAGFKVDPALPVPADAPNIGEPVSLTGGRVVIPVTMHDGDGASIELLATPDGRQFTALGSVPAGTELPAGLWAIGSGAAPAAAIFAVPSSTDFILVTGGKVTRFSSSGLPGPVESLTFSDSKHGLASVTTNGCNDGKADCWTRTELYMSSDGGHTWTVTATPAS